MKRNLGLAAAMVALVMVLVGCKPEVEHVHTFSGTWSSDETSHWHEATCGHDEKGNLESHHFSEWKTVAEPTEYEDGSKERTCSTCEYVDTEIIFALGHHHNIKSEWSSDETSHWHAYDCGRPEHFEDKAAHIEDSGTVTKEPTCTEKGSMVYKCTVCKKVLRTEDVNAKGHSYGDWKVTDGKHWKECSECGKKIEEADHSYGDWVSTDSSKHWKECGVCGKKTEEAAHSGNWTITDGKHWKECNECGKKIEEAHNFLFNGNTWQECVCSKKIPVSLDTLGTYDSTKMTFGVYPQTIKASGVTVDKNIKNTEITGADYYLGSDGAWYAECVENVFDEFGTGDQHKYSDGNTVAKKDANSVKYFKVEPIEWVYLAGTKCLHAKKILTADVQWPASSNNYNNYKNSNIRSWLNETFYNSAFTESQKKKIKTTTVDNSASSTGYTSNGYACENTNDKVYLLSFMEIRKTGNGFSEVADRIRFPTDYALANYCNKNSSGGGFWWLRSPDSSDSHLARAIAYDGGFRMVYDVCFEFGGVVPALSISE